MASGRIAGPLGTAAVRVVVGTLVCTLGIASCGSGNDFSTSYMALDAAGTRKRTAFFTDTESIFCVGELSASKTGTTVNAIIRQVATQGMPEDVVIAVGEQVPQNLGKNVLSFQLVRKIASSDEDQMDDPWPAGSFECDLQVDGILKSTVPFDVLTPDCPLYPAAQGVRCAGFYPLSIKCPAADQTKLCTCSPTMGTWQCP